MPIAMTPTDAVLDAVTLGNEFNVDLEGLGVDGLRRVVEAQRDHIHALRNDLAIANGALRLMKDSALDHPSRRLSHPVVGIDHEQSHEFMSNRLIGQIEQLRRERGELCYQVEAEEEFLMNSLQKRLDQVQREKLQLEAALEQAQESLVMGKLKAGMDGLRTSGSSAVASPSSAKMAAILGSSAVPFGSSRCSSVLSSASNCDSPTQDLQKKVSDLQAENSRLLMENIRLSQQLRRHGLQLSSSNGAAHAVLSTPGTIPLRRSDSGMSDHSASRSGSISDLRLAASHSGHRLGTEVTTTDDEALDDDDEAILSISPLRPTSKQRANSKA